MNKFLNILGFINSPINTNRINKLDKRVKTLQVEINTLVKFIAEDENRIKKLESNTK